MPSGPADIVAVRAAGDQLQVGPARRFGSGRWLRAGAGIPGGDFAVELAVLFRGEIAAAAPALVADAPELDVEGLFVAVGGALVGERVRAGGLVAVLDPLVEVARGQAAEVGREIGLAADGACRWP